jgi:sugar lactone lactonase YvrE
VRRTAFVALVVTLVALVGGPVHAGERDGSHQAPPEIIRLPNGFQPEGIARGEGSTFFAGSLRNGAIVRGDLRTGQRKVFIRGSQGRMAVGLEVDRRDRLWVAGGATGTARVYDADDGDLLRTYAFAPANSAFINDVVVTKRAAYFTDSFSARLFVVPIRHGRLGPARTLDLTGDLQVVPGQFNLNGIAASRSGRTLLVIQSNTGLLFRVNARTGVTREVDVRGADLTSGDGLLRSGRTLYVVRNQVEEIAELRLGRTFRSARLVDTHTDPDLDTPTTVAKKGRYLFAVNARFASAPDPTPQTRYDIVRVDTR